MGNLQKKNLEIQNLMRLQTEKIKLNKLSFISIDLNKFKIENLRQ